MWYQRASIWIGFDPRECDGYAVSYTSMKHHMTVKMPIHGLVLSKLRKMNLYRREVEKHNGQLWDPISEAPMSTEFAISRFLTPILAGSGLALFTDSDVMARANLSILFELADPKYAVQVVKHNHQPKNDRKMDNQIQTSYSRKNWSSVMLFNCEHPSNRKLTVDLINEVPGRDLHNFCWLEDDEIGELPPEWNYLVGHTKLPNGVKPKMVHWTDGLPSMPGYEDAEYADEFAYYRDTWAANIR